jgi:hypothetical protein
LGRARLPVVPLAAGILWASAAGVCFPSLTHGNQASDGNSFRVVQYGADQFDETSGDAQQNPRQIEPRRVQPFVETGADEPADDKGCRQDESKLAIPPHLQPEALLLGRTVFFGIGAVGIHNVASTDAGGQPPQAYLDE